MEPTLVRGRVELDGVSVSPPEFWDGDWGSNFIIGSDQVVSIAKQEGRLRRPSMSAEHVFDAIHADLLSRDQPVLFSADAYWGTSTTTNAIGVSIGQCALDTNTEPPRLESVVGQAMIDWGFDDLDEARLDVDISTSTHRRWTLFRLGFQYDETDGDESGGLLYVGSRAVSGGRWIHFVFLNGGIDRDGRRITTPIEEVLNMFEID